MSTRDAKTSSKILDKIAHGTQENELKGNFRRVDNDTCIPFICEDEARNYDDDINQKCKYVDSIPRSAHCNVVL